MKSVGIISFHRSINYGAVLQVYALQRTLTNLGFHSEVIDYRPHQLGITTLSPFCRLRHYAWQKVQHKLQCHVERLRKTEIFRKENFHYSALTYLDSTTLHTDPPLYDAYITGSDQVWNPTIINNDSSWFLTFAPERTTRISYAASFGISEIPQQFFDNYRTSLNELHCISCREFDGRRLVFQLTGRDAEIVLDPTLLLSSSEWTQLAIPQLYTHQYILCYYMPGDILVNNCITMLAKAISRITKLKILSIGQKEYHQYNIFRNGIFDAGPLEFLSLVNDASFVITNSFHGIAFSINFKKPFIIPINLELSPDKSLSSRITTLLSLFGLQDRIYPAGYTFGVNKYLTLDYCNVDEILKQHKEKSFAFLKSSLSSTQTNC